MVHHKSVKTNRHQSVVNIQLAVTIFRFRLSEITETIREQHDRSRQISKVQVIGNIKQAIK